MCGIAGLFRPKGPGGSPEVDRTLVPRMVALLHHRGPIEDGFHSAAGAEFGMARLSIIDVEGGHQPIYNEDRTLAVVFNGQIYNYVELMSELKAKGHVFATQSDTEVLVHLYEEEGVKMLDRLNGMFAFAIHDLKRNTAFVARDRLGVKPLYYTWAAGRLLFASELKALLLDRTIDRAIEPSALAEYLTLMYIRAPRTPFHDIAKLRPGHYLIADDRGVRETCWWTPRPEPVELSYAAACERLLELLDDSVRLRLRSDVPVGSLLSGGLDSSAVTALAARHLDQPVNSFTIGFADSEFDELPYAEAVAKAYGTNHHVEIVRTEDAIDLLPLLVWHLDEPNADSAMIPTYMISKLAGSKLRVVLCGAGGDELFGGYSRYFEGKQVEHFYRQLPAGLRSSVLGPLIANMSDTLGYRARMNDLPQPDRFLWQCSTFPPDLATELTGYAGGSVSFAPEYEVSEGADPVNRLMTIDLQAYLIDDILHLTDRMSMATSLEIREPLLDHRLVEFAIGLPSEYKINQSSRAWKRCLKDAVAPLLPKQIVSRPKWGFGGPVSKWMKNGVERITRQLYEESSAVGHGLLDGAAVGRYLSGSAPYDALQRNGRLWSLLILELWSRVFIDGKGERPSIKLRELAGD